MVIVSANVREYFHEQVDTAVRNRAVEVDATTIAYIVNLLTTYTRAQHLFDETEDGLDIRPLAIHYADALNAPSVTEKSAALRKLGDIALFISGLFSGSLNRKLIDIDYYIAMGGTAYSYVQELSATSASGQDLHTLFAELAEKFPELVDVLGEVGDQTHLKSNSDVLRLYEIWLKTGSKRVGEQLQRLGLTPSVNATSVATH